MLHNWIGNVYAELKDLAKAAGHYRKALALNPLYDRALHALGKYLVILESPPRALQAFSCALSLSLEEAKKLSKKTDFD